MLAGSWDPAHQPVVITAVNSDILKGKKVHDMYHKCLIRLIHLRKIFLLIRLIDIIIFVFDLKTGQAEHLNSK